MDVTDEETKANWIAQKLVHHIEKINKDGWRRVGRPGHHRLGRRRQEGAQPCEGADGGRIRVSGCAAHALNVIPGGFEDAHVPAMKMDPIEEEADDFDVEEDL